MPIELIKTDPKPNEPKTYRIGDTFKHRETGQPYMLVRADVSKVNLNNLLKGDMWVEPFVVADYNKITQDEFNKIADGDANDFIPTNYQLTEI